MPLPDSRFVESPSLQNYFVDKDDGEPLAAGVVTFYSDVSRSVLKPIYQQVRLSANVYGFVQLNNPITLSSVGTYLDNNGNDINIYLYPYAGLPTDATQGAVELYYITVEAAAPPVGTGALQFIREAWPPGIASGTNPQDTFEGTDNILSNTQFSQVLFLPLSGMTFSVTGANQSQEIAPGWFIDTNGTGTVTVAQISVADVNAPTNPPYALEISATGITTLHIRQRLAITSRLLEGAFLSGTFIAKSLGATEAIISLNYMPSASSTVTLFQEIASGTTSPGVFTTISNSSGVQITLVNPNNAPSGYVDIYLDIPVTAHVQVSSVQVVSVQNAASSTPFLQISNERQTDHLFHYYKPQLEYKPIPSLLVGWDFPLNPAQLGTSFTVGTTAGYTWDQTIAKTNSANAAMAREATYGSLQVISNAGTIDSVMVMQYMAGLQARKILNTNLSVNIQGYSITNAVNVRVYLIRAGAATSIPTLATIPGTLNINGTFTALSAGWTFVPRGNFGDALAVMAIDNPDPSGDVKFSGWRVTDAAQLADTDKFAIIVTFQCAVVSQSIEIQSISLVPGDISTRPAPQTMDEVLRECQYYYEKSYAPGTLPGTVTTVGERYALNELGSRVISALVTDDVVFLQSLSLVYDQQKRIAVTPVFYSPASITPGLIQGRVLRNGADIIPSGIGSLGTSPQNYAIAKWTFTGSSPKGVVLICNDTSTAVYSSGAGTPGLDGDESMMLYHYYTDARLGII